jgi:hypothetical protein
MRARTGLAGILILAGAAFAGDLEDREKLLGHWQNGSGNKEVWMLESKGELLHVTRSEEGKVTLEAECRPDGSDCNGTESGKKIKISMYYNGPALVQMETHDSSVTTRKFTLNGESGLSIEVKPITGPGKAETITLTRNVEAASAK